jgi:hypothetical protein
LWVGVSGGPGGCVVGKATSQRERGSFLRCRAFSCRTRLHATSPSPTFSLRPSPPPPYAGLASSTPWPLLRSHSKRCVAGVLGFVPLRPFPLVVQMAGCPLCVPRSLPDRWLTTRCPSPLLASVLVYMCNVCMDRARGFGLLTVRPGADVDFFLGALCVGWRRIAVCTQQRGKLCVLWVGDVAMPASTPPFPGRCGRITSSAVCCCPDGVQAGRWALGEGCCG